MELTLILGLIGFILGMFVMYGMEKVSGKLITKKADNFFSMTKDSINDFKKYMESYKYHDYHVDFNNINNKLIINKTKDGKINKVTFKEYATLSENDWGVPIKEYRETVVDGKTYQLCKHVFEQELDQKIKDIIKL